MGTKFLQQYGGLLLFLVVAMALGVTFGAEEPTRNLPKLAIAGAVFAGFEAALFVWLRSRRRRIEVFDAVNVLLGVAAVSMAFLTHGVYSLIGGFVWLVYQLLEGRLEDRLAGRRAS